MDGTPHPAPVKRRFVAYLSGFDPQGPPHYHQLFREQAALQAQVNGWGIEVGPRKKSGDAIAWWSVVGHEAQTPTEVRYEFLRWDDIVRAHWPRSRWGLYKATAWASWQMWRNGVMWRTLTRSWPMGVAIGLPGLLMLALTALASALAAALAAWAAHGQPLGALVGALVTGLLLVVLARWAEARSHMAWLMRSLACLVRQGRDQTPELEARLDAPAAHLAGVASSGDHDEVVVVGHSSGAMMAAIALSRALRLLPGGKPVASLGLLTLGHCSPLLSLQPEAQRYREELQRLCNDGRVHWVDAAAPPDGCSFPLVDPTEGLPLATDAARPQLVNPKFAQAFGPERYQEIRRDKFRCHFQYLMAGERPTAFDLFSLVAGARSFRERTRSLGSVRDFQQFRLRKVPRT